MVIVHVPYEKWWKQVVLVYSLIESKHLKPHSPTQKTMKRSICILARGVSTHIASMPQHWYTLLTTILSCMIMNSDTSHIIVSGKVSCITGMLSMDIQYYVNIYMYSLISNNLHVFPPFTARKEKDLAVPLKV